MSPKLTNQLVGFSKSKYDCRYADNWAEISRRARELTGGLCCYPRCKKPASSTHHALYRDKKGAIAGREVPGVTVFPLCDYHHSAQSDACAHHRRNWRKDSKRPELENKNTARYYKLLREGWKAKAAPAERRLN